MAEWKCSNCGYHYKADAPPAQCPQCKEKCEFTDISCYIPECGGEDSGNTDPRLG